VRYSTTPYHEQKLVGQDFQPSVGSSRRQRGAIPTKASTLTPSFFTSGLEGMSPLQRWFVRCLAFILFGYGVIGRGFAYLGFNPLFVGELVLGLGLVAMLSSKHLGEALKTGTARWLAIFIGWSALMTLPYLPTHGLMALRDGVLWGYALFGLIVASVVMAAPQAMRWLLLRYRLFALAFLCTAWAMWTISSMELLKWVTVPGTEVGFFNIKGGDQLVHLAAIAAFVSVGMSKHRMLMLAGILFNFAFLLTSKRAGMVAFALAFGFLVLMNPPRLKLSGIIYAGILSVTLLLLINPRIDLGGDREISVEQMTDNVVSTFDQSGSSTLDETKSWRLDWWTKIINYSLSPRYILTGKGYGINLATDDGFQVRDNDELRSPHNAHLNILARSGVPGFLMWVLVHGTWFFSMLAAARRAKRQRMFNWHGIFCFLMCYWIALMTNASFDVFLEGPMGGIWLWSVMGFGLAARYHFDRNPELAHDAVAVEGIHPPVQTHGPAASDLKRPLGSTSPRPPVTHYPSPMS
jgi:hypothetical protein